MLTRCRQRFIAFTGILLFIEGLVLDNDENYLKQAIQFLTFNIMQRMAFIFSSS